MYDRNALCKKIIEIYPEIGECAINVEVTFDSLKNVWIVDLKKDTHELKHHLELPDADLCMNGKQYIPRPGDSTA